ncbi:MAG: hypothetical protein ABS49_00785 [Erythrobacter sp. SCN 62-14]|nr:MAG: hypothetical protein ABS49_00785 [Erythrobacter sp. SCN 62-14]
MFVGSRFRKERLQIALDKDAGHSVVVLGECHGLDDASDDALKLAHVIKHVEGIFEFGTRARQLAGEVLYGGWMHGHVARFGKARQLNSQVISFPT